MAGITGATVVVVASAAAWLLLPDEIQETFTIYERITALLLGALLLACAHALVRPRVDVTEEGLTVVNGYKKREFVWAQVLAIHLPPGAPWATIDLSDGTSCSVMALQGSDGARAKKAVRQIRAMLS